MKLYRNLVVGVMTTYDNWDFTNSAYRTFKQIFPEIRLIISDGGSVYENVEKMKKLTDEFIENKSEVNLIVSYNSSTEACRNLAASLIETKYILTMDNDTKVLGRESIDVLFETIEASDSIAQTGAYAIKVLDWEKRKALVSKEFKSNIEVDAFSAYFSMHRTKVYKKVGGMKIGEFFYDIPKKLYENKWQPGYTGDMVIGKYYKKNNYKLITPNKEVPVIHWGKAYRAIKNDDLNDWWYKNCKNIRCNPLDDWEKYV